MITKLTFGSTTKPDMRHSKMLAFVDDNLGLKVEVFEDGHRHPWTGKLLGMGIITGSGHTSVVLEQPFVRPSLRVIPLYRVITIHRYV